MSEGVPASGLSPGLAGESPAPSLSPAEPHTDRLGAWRPVLLRVGLGTLALLGLSAVGTLSMLAGVEGARANPSATPMVVATQAQPQPTSPGNTAKPGASASTLPATMGSVAVAPVGSCSGRLLDGRVVLNRATLEELRHIPGVGPKRAGAILALRERLGRFKKPVDLVRIRGIGPKTLKRMQAAFVLDDPNCAEPGPGPEKKPK